MKLIIGIPSADPALSVSSIRTQKTCQVSVLSFAESDMTIMRHSLLWQAEGSMRRAHKVGQMSGRTQQS
jgi:hypothetical protein